MAFGRTMAGLGGELMLLSALFSLVSIPFVLSVADDSNTSDISVIMQVLFSVSGGLIDAIVVALAILAVISIVGSVSAMARSNYILSLLGGVASVFGIAGPIGLAGLFLVAVSRKEFGRRDWVLGSDHADARYESSYDKSSSGAKDNMFSRR